MALLFDKHTERPERPRYSIVPRPYQHDALDGCFRIWDEGTPGALIRVFTGGGKTISTCMVGDRWLQRGPNYKMMVVSYEKQLVWQFSQEIEDVLSIRPGIEMEKEEIDPYSVPQIVVASRQTLMTHKLLSVEQRAFLNESGYDDEQLRLCTFNLGKRLVRAIKEGADRNFVEAELDEWSRHYMCDHERGVVSRLHKFDWRDNWLVAYDEAHKHVYQMATVGILVDWFDQNPNSRRLGMTATPKRSDGISIGSKMFPGVAIDYPLCTVEGKCAVRDGYAVPYLQKYIKVEAVDFAEIKELAGANTKKWDAEVAKRLETELAACCEPMLDMVEDRKTLIFSPSVDMAKGVSEYINARAKCRCVCGRTQWHAKSVVGDGATCRWCNHLLTDDDLLVTPDQQSNALWGEIPANDRKGIYEGHQSGEFQFLSVCGLCREGYNDCSISCIAIFRPVSKKASSLAEQMKGRGSRPEKGCVEGLDTAEERLEAIARSSVPDCLIIDLTGITGLGDCATTVQIYAEGEDDDVVVRAEEIVHGGMEDVTEAIQQAKEEIAEEREAKRLERIKREEAAREAARQRARARAQVDYSVHEVGHGVSASPNSATDKQLRYIRFLGMELHGWEPSKRQAGRIITQLKEGTEPIQVAFSNGIRDEFWAPACLTSKQRWKLQKLGVNAPPDMTSDAASKMIDRLVNGGKPSASDVLADIKLAQNESDLDTVSNDIKKHWSRYSKDEKEQIRESGLARRKAVQHEFEF